MRIAASCLLAALALSLAGYVAVRLPADIDREVPLEGREPGLDRWVVRTAPFMWGAAAAAGLAAALLPLPLPVVPVAAGRRLALLLALFCVAAACWVSVARMDRVPHVFDEFNYLFQAKNFARGQLSARTPAHLEHFNQLFFVERDGRWYGSSLPGHPLMLVPGVLLGVPWLVNPLAAGLTLLVVHRFLERLLGAGAALAGAALLATSPLFLILSGTLMAHGTALLCAAALVHFGTRFVDEGRAGDGLLAGLAFGMGFLARPQAVLAWALPLGGFTLWRLVRGSTPLSGRLVRAAILVALPVAPLLAFDVVQNRALTGDWLDTPRSIVSPSHRLGFGEDVGRPEDGGKFTGHTPREGLRNLGLNLRLLSRDLFGWWGGSLLLVPLSLLGFVSRRGTSPRPAGGTSVRDGLTLAWAALLLASGVVFAYFTPSPIFGPRYLFETLPGLLLLTVEGGRRLAALLGGRAAILRALVGGLGFLSLASLLLYRSAQLDRYQPLSAAPLRKALAGLPPGRALVLTPPGFFTMRAQSFNDPDLSGEVVLGADLGAAKNRALLADMADRRAYRLRFDRETETATITPYEQDTPRVIVVGMDAATWSVIDPLVEGGALPTFARLKREGAWATLSTLEPTYSPALWTTIATGVLPARHGIAHFVVGQGGGDPGHESDRLTTSDVRDAPAIWEMVAQRGLRANVFNYWCTWPAEPIAGTMVTDRATIPGLPHRVHPARHLPWIEGRLGLDVRREGGMTASQHAGVDEERLLDAFLGMLDRDPAALGILYFRKLDIEQHQSWKFFRPEGFDLRPEEIAANGQRIPELYAKYDGYLARLLAEIPGATFVVVSDHGMESATDLPRETVLRVNRLLSHLGLAVFGPGSPLADRTRSTAVGPPAPIGSPVTIEILAPERAARVKERLASLRLHGAPVLQLVDEAGPTLTYLLSPEAASHKGKLDPPHQGIPWDKLIGARMHATSGQHDHAPPGILVVHGKGIAPAEIADASIVDLTPTLLALLGLPQGEGLDGKPLLAALPPEAAAALADARPVRYERGERVTAELPDEVVKRTKEELRALGYLP